jgi:hypothetical protein
MNQYRSRSDPAHQASESRPGETPDGPQLSALERLTAALGWDRVPQPTDEERREAERKLAAAQAEARRIYGLDEAA